MGGNNKGDEGRTHTLTELEVCVRVLTVGFHPGT